MSDFHSLFILMVVIWTAGKAFRVVGLPMVFGELIGGVLVGPAVFGLVDANSHVIEVIAELGIFFLMLHTGLKTDHKELVYASSKSIFIALGSMALPFVMGYYASLLFGYSLIEALFIGMCLSITGLALAVRLFKDFALSNTRAANLSIGAAVLNDILALVLFSVILSMAEGNLQMLDIILLCLKIFLFMGGVLFIGHTTAPILNKVIYLGNKGFTVTLIIALLMGLLAEAIGLHLIIGAFLAGLFIREEVIDDKTFNKIEDRVYGLSYSFFGPIFFASLAFHLDLTAFSTLPMFLIVIIFIAIVGKVVGAGIPALLQGNTPLESLLIGLAMNNRGAVELVIAAVGLEKGIINQQIFSVLIIVAFATTVFSIISTVPFAKELRAAE